MYYTSLLRKLKMNEFVEYQILRNALPYDPVPNKANCNKINIMCQFTQEKLCNSPPTQSINNSFRSCVRQVNDIYIKTINRDLFCRSGEDSGVRDIWSHVGARNTWAFTSSSDHDHLPDISISGKICIATDFPSSNKQTSIVLKQ